ncbi:helix-turn-helix domain-containing protein [Ruminococcus sp. 5_1_39BFAA]|uniref:helix-turn-helix domain-containing protein n=1 Tax=Ruminococcus sp. 5_1_39BFAA TaxID=457412 RepID=UPI003566F016
MNINSLMRTLFFDNDTAAKEMAYFGCLNSKLKHEIQKEFYDILFRNQEYTIKHNPYDQEIRETASIRNGDTEKLVKSWEEEYPGVIGTLAKTPLRQSKNHGIVLVTIASRAALEGGLPPEISYSLSDIYIQKIEDASTPEAALQLGRLAEYQYAILVNEFKNKKTTLNVRKNSKVNSCKDYIFSHLHEKIVIADIAKELRVNKNYLCELFKKEEGITIGQYILQQKIRSIQNMLIYSHYTYSEIASYFGFSSQSHLGQQFKKATGITLHQYRETYGIDIP